jgi:hypothetical protein
MLQQTLPAVGTQWFTDVVSTSAALTTAVSLMGAQSGKASRSEVTDALPILQLEDFDLRYEDQLQRQWSSHDDSQTPLHELHD